MYTEQIRKALRLLKFNTVMLTSWKGKTTKTINLPRKDNYIATTCDHVVAVKFGLVKCPTSNQRSRVKAVYKVVPF